MFRTDAEKPLDSVLRPMKVQRGSEAEKPLYRLFPPMKVKLCSYGELYVGRMPKIFFRILHSMKVQEGL